MVAGVFKKLAGYIAPPPEKHGGREQWASRSSYLLASVGGAVGMGNMLRYPSQIYNNNGLQWFIPYLMALLLLAVPCMMLEVSMGMAYKSGSVVAYNNLSSRLKGTGLGLVFVGFTVGSYFVPILAWIMVYFRHSFRATLPWDVDGTSQDKLDAAEDFWLNKVIQAPPSVLNEGTGFYEYLSTGMVGELAGWTVFIWVVVWLCMFRGVSVTGRAVWFTMGLPIIMMIIMIGRSVSLENAADGIKLYFATWNSDKLASRQIWQAACGQVFFSTGVGFGYYTAYASYNQKYSNPVQDAWIIVFSNASFEVFAAFAAFGVVGYLGLHPDKSSLEVGTYSLGFIVYPAVLAQMPAAPFWSILFFATLMLVGIGSSFAMLDAAVTLVMDSDFGKKPNARIKVVTTMVVLTCLMSLMYCTEFGYELTNGVDHGINNVSLVFVVFAESITSTSVYRFKDVVSQCGLLAYAVFNFCYVGGMILGVALANAISAEVGAGVGLGVPIVGIIVAVLLSKTPDAEVPKFFSKSSFLRRFYFLAFYSGNQLRHDLNPVVSKGSNWSLPFWWPVLLRYISSPILLIILSLEYPVFRESYAKDPIYIFGFAVAHLAMVSALSGFVVPRWFNVFIPKHRLGDGDKPYAVNVPLKPFEHESEDAMEGGSDQSSIEEEPKTNSTHVE
ncbi:hypothetical protein FQN54_002724 [Arachnomyces sp. PD_36]|nr:hypothetical protein FQN54_002724 [Arachnomyces sp. PD_36]